VADGPPAHDDHGQALAVATGFHAAGESVRALELLPDLVAARPDDLAIRLLLARCLATAGTPSVALAAADAAVACDPTSWEAHAVLAEAAVGIEPERARTASERAVALAPHEPEALRVLATVRAALDAGPGATATGATAEPTSGPSAGRGLGAALGLRPSAPPGIEVAEPRLEPRLPAALDPARTTAPPRPEAVPPVPPVPPHDAASGPPAAAGPAPASPATGPPLAAPSAPPPDASPPPGPAATAPPLAAPTPPPPLHARPPAATAPPPAAPSPPLSADAGPPPVPAEGAPAGHRIEPRLPAALGGAAPTAAEAGPDGEREPVGAGRLALRLVGLVAWLVLGFRIGAQAIGGPLGIGLFVLVVVGVALMARRVTTR